MVEYHPLPVRRRHVAVIQHISVIKYIDAVLVSIFIRCIPTVQN